MLSIGFAWNIADRILGIHFIEDQVSNFIEVSSATYVCLNTESYRDEYVIAFELYTSIGGFVILDVSFF